MTHRRRIIIALLLLVLGCAPGPLVAHTTMPTAVIQVKESK